MPLSQGQILQHRYRVARLLGQGGMGAIYRAWDVRLDIPVAIKEMIPQPGLDPATLAQLREQFEQEAKVLARLRHPHLVNVTNFFEEYGNAYLIMEFVEGENLAKRIEEEQGIPEAQLLVWADQLMDALAYCHAQGIIHRDVKPQNVVIRPEGDVILVDFGLVKLWDPNDPHTQTVIRGMGSPEYAPPEQYSEHRGHTGPHSDVYSLGATLYHALTGQAPWQATDRIFDPEHFPTVQTLAPTINERTAFVVTKAMEVRGSQRWRGIGEMRSALFDSTFTPPKPEPQIEEQPTPVHTHEHTVRIEGEEPDEVQSPVPPPIKKPEPADTRSHPPIWQHIPQPMRWLVPFIALLLFAGLGLLISNSDDILPSSDVLFTSTRDGRREIYRLTVEGTTERVTQTPLRAESWVSVRAANGALLFTSNLNGKREIHRLTAEGAREQVTHSPSGAESWGPVVASNGAILFTSTRDGRREIYRLTVEGEIEQVTDTPLRAESWDPTVARNGNMLFTSTRNGKREIYRLTADGRTERVTQSPSGTESWGATVASNGAILFTSTRNGKREIYRLTGSGDIEQVTHTSGEAESWAPKATTRGVMLFTSTRDGKREVYRLTIEGEIEQVTHTSDDSESWTGYDDEPNEE